MTEEVTRIIEAARKSAEFQREIAKGVGPADAECHTYAANVMLAFVDTIIAEAY